MPMRIVASLIVVESVLDRETLVILLILRCPEDHLAKLSQKRYLVFPFTYRHRCSPVLRELEYILLKQTDPEDKNEGL